MIEMLYISSVDISKPNGPGVNEQQFVAAAVREYGSSVRFIVPYPASPLPEELPLDSIEFLPKIKRRSLFSLLVHQVAKWKAFRKAQTDFEPKYVVMRSSVFPVADLLISKAASFTFLKTAGSGKFEVFKRALIARLTKPLHSYVFGGLLNNCAAIDVVSEIHKRSLEHNFHGAAGKVVVLDNAVDTKMFSIGDKRSIRKKFGIDGYDFIVGYVGNLADTRGATELLKAFRHVSHRDRLGIVIVSGDGVGVTQLRKHAEENGISDRVHFLGPVGLFEVPDLVSMMDVAVSFRDDDGCSELKVRQYLSCGVPVVASAKVNGFIEDAGVGAIVDRNDYVSIGREISRFLSTEELSPQDIRKFALANLSYDSSMRARRAMWRDASSVSQSKN